MTNNSVDEQQVEDDLEQIAKIRSIAWQRKPENLLALIEAIQLKLLMEDISRRQRQVYRTIIDYFEDVLEERIEKDDNTKLSEVRESVSGYIRNVLKSLGD
jgi:hypothetical protein